MAQPLDFVDANFPSHVCKLDKALYGFKQSPWAWYTKLSNTLLNCSFITFQADTSLFIFKPSTACLLCLIYVDDILLTGSNLSLLDQLITSLNHQFALKDLSPLHYFLGLEVHPIEFGLHLSQTKYILDLLHKCAMHDCKFVSSPMSSSQLLSKYDGNLLIDGIEYRTAVGALQYYTITWSNIVYVVNKVCQFMHTPTNVHWQVVKKVLRYLSGTSNLGLSVKPSLYYNLVC